MPSYVSLVEYAKSLDPDGSVAAAIEMMAQNNPIIDLFPVVEGNLPTGHRTTLRSSLPAVIWRKLYQGVPVSASSRAQIEETCGELTGRNEIDSRLVKMYGPDQAAFRLSESKAFIQSLGQQMAATMFYGSTGNGDPFNGFATRYSSLGAQCISAGGSSNNTSIYVAVLGTDTVHGIFPKGSQAGIQHQDLGEIDALDDLNNKFRAMADMWLWDFGLVVRDYRAIVRIANVNAADLLTAGTASGTQAATAATNILRKIIEAKYRIPPTVRNTGRLVAFMNPRVTTAFKLLGLEKSANAVPLMTGQDQIVNKWDGIQFVECEGLLNTETAVS